MLRLIFHQECVASFSSPNMISSNLIHLQLKFLLPNCSLLSDMLIQGALIFSKFVVPCWKVFQKYFCSLIKLPLSLFCCLSCYVNITIIHYVFIKSQYVRSSILRSEHALWCHSCTYSQILTNCRFSSGCFYTSFSLLNLKEEIEPQLPPTAAVISIHQNSWATYKCQCCRCPR